MLLILKQKRLARAGALKALDFATTRSAANCERFVEQYGLRTISAMFMGKCKVNRLAELLVNMVEPNNIIITLIPSYISATLQQEFTAISGPPFPLHPRGGKKRLLAHQLIRSWVIFGSFRILQEHTVVMHIPVPSTGCHCR